MAAQCALLGSWSCSCPIPSSLLPLRENQGADNEDNFTRSDRGQAVEIYPSPATCISRALRSCHSKPPSIPTRPRPCRPLGHLSPCPTPGYASMSLCGATFLREVQSEDSISSKTKNPSHTFPGSAYMLPMMGNSVPHKVAHCREALSTISSF